MTDLTAAEAEPGIGHNMDDSLPSIDQINADLHLKNMEALDRTSALLAKGPNHTTVTDDTGDEAATQFMVALRARWKASEADRVADKTPWDDRAGVVQAFYKKEILDPLAALGAKINEGQTTFKRVKAEAERKRREEEAKRLRDAEVAAAKKRAEEEAAKRAEEDRVRKEQQAIAEKARKEAEEAAAAASRKRNAESKAAAEAEAHARRKAAAEAEEQNRQEQAKIDAERAKRDEEALLEANRIAEERSAAEQAASASLADLSRARGEKGGVSSLRQFINWRDIDRDKLDYAALGPYFKDKAIDAALDSYADANKATVHNGIKTGKQPIKGVTFYLDAKNSGRA